MQPSRFGGAGSSYVHPFIISVILLALVLMFVLPRKKVILPFLATALLIPMDQVLVIGGLHFQMLRVLIVFGWIRLFTLKSSRGTRLLAGGWNGIDVALVLWASATAVAFVLLWQSSSAFVNQLGTLFTVFGIYFLFRFFVRDEEDVVDVVKTLANITAFVAIIMTIEKATAFNPYACFWPGGPSGTTVMLRDGHIRAMAGFAHPLLAGSFGGIVLPLFFVLWFRGGKKNKRTAILGAVASTIIVLAASSSTPLLAYVAGLCALAFWPVREHMRLFRWGLAITLTVLHLLMKAPVWALIGRIDVTGSSSSYHRYQLVDQFIRRFGDWWLLGTKSNGDWGWDMWDQANQYVAVGESGGLLAFICFLAIIVLGFRYLGRVRLAAHGNRTGELMIWGVCAALFANVVAFFGISYYDQTMVCWYFLLAVIPAIAISLVRRKPMGKARQKTQILLEHVAEPVPAGSEPRVSDTYRCRFLAGTGFRSVTLAIVL